MPPRTPTVWTGHPIRDERLRERMDGRHRELTVQAKMRSRSYRRSRAAPDTDEARRLRADFLAALGRLSSFESASQRLARSRHGFDLRMRADDVSRDYFQLWHVVARHGQRDRPLEETEDERLDYFATNLGRLEGIADVLIVVGRNVRLFARPAALATYR